MPKAPTKSEIAKQLGVSRMSLHRYSQRPDFPGLGDLDALRAFVANVKGGKQPTAEAVAPAAVIPSAKAKEPVVDPSFIVTTQQLTELLEVSKPTISNWRKSGLPRLPDKEGGGVRFDLRQVLPWVKRHYDTRAKEAVERAKSPENDAKTRKEQAMADLKENERDLKLGAVVPTEDHWRCFLGMCRRFTGAFKGRPQIWAQALQGQPAERIREYLDVELRAIFADLQNMDSPGNIPPDAEQFIHAGIAKIIEPMMRGVVE